MPEEVSTIALMSEAEAIKTGAVALMSEAEATKTRAVATSPTLESVVHISLGVTSDLCYHTVPVPGTSRWIPEIIDLRSESPSHPIARARVDLVVPSGMQESSARLEFNCRLLMIIVKNPDLADGIKASLTILNEIGAQIFSSEQMSGDTTVMIDLTEGAIPLFHVSTITVELSGTASEDYQFSIYFYGY